MIQLWLSEHVKKRKDQYGSCLTVNNNFIMFPNVWSMNIMLKWIKEEEIWQEIHNPGGVVYMIRMERSENKQKWKIRMKVYLII